MNLSVPILGFDKWFTTHFLSLGQRKKMYAVFTKIIHEISANSSAGLAWLSNRNYSIATFFVP